MFPYREAKEAIEHAVNLSPEALHIYTGLLAFLFLSLLRGSWRALTPLAGVLCLALAGEAWDLWEDIPRLGYWRWADSIRDVGATVLAWGRLGFFAFGLLALLALSLARLHLGLVFGLHRRNPVRPLGL